MYKVLTGAQMYSVRTLTQTQEGLDATLKALKEMGYQGHISFECGCEGDRATVLPAAIDLLRKQWEEA